MTEQAAAAQDAAGPDPEPLFSSFQSATGLLVAVSGGPDSLALLALAADWSKTPGRPPLFAATFDHGLRAASGSEAAMVAALCTALGIPHTTLHWSADKPATRVQERARAARYDALVTHARTIGASHLLTGHHADDQAETILFRLLRGSHIPGLAGMRAAVLRGNILHCRPLLGLRKAALVALCRARALPYVEDPSNDDAHYARTRMRALTPLLEEAGLDPAGWARLAARAARTDEALAYATGFLRESLAIEETDEGLIIAASPLADVPFELVLRLMAQEIARVARPSRLERAEPVIDVLIRNLKAGRPLRITLGGTILDLRDDGRLSIEPEGPRRRGT